MGCVPDLRYLRGKADALCPTELWLTRILLYAYDRGEPSKQPLPLALLDPLAVNGLGVSDVSRGTLPEVQFSCDA
jgi:hypothetical protein